MGGDALPMGVREQGMARVGECSVDNHSNPTAKMNCINTRSNTCNEFTKKPPGFIRSIPAGPREPCRFVTWRCIFQVSALSSLCVGAMPIQLETGDENLGLIPEREHKKATTCKERWQTGDENLGLIPEREHKKATTCKGRWQTCKSLAHGKRR